MSRPALGPTQTPIQWVLEVRRPGRQADHQLRPVLRLGMGGTIPPSPQMASWRVEGQISLIRFFANKVLRQCLQQTPLRK